MADIHLRQVKKSYGATHVITDVDMDVEVISQSGGKALVKNAVLDPTEVPARVRGINGKARLGIRPQYVTPRRDDGQAAQMKGRVALTERLGAETVVEVTLTDGGRIIAALSRDVTFEIVEPVALSFNPEEAHLFPA